MKNQDELLTIAQVLDELGGYVSRRTFYRWREIGRAPAGIKLPFHVITTWTDGRSDVQLSSAQTNVPIDAAKFNQPSPPARPKQ